jgi:hypothetical protein
MLPLSPTQEPFEGCAAVLLTLTCCAVPCHAVPCCAVLCHAMLCRAVPCCALQYRHYEACLQIFQLNPTQDSKEFAEFITFIAQV